MLESLPERQEATGTPAGDTDPEGWHFWERLLLHKDTGAGELHFGILPLTCKWWRLTPPPASQHQLQDTQSQAASHPGTKPHPPVGKPVHYNPPAPQPATL